MSVSPNDLFLDQIISSKQIPVALGQKNRIYLRKVDDHGWVLEKVKYKKKYFFSLANFSIKKKLWSKNNFVVENDPRLLLLFFCQALRSARLDTKLAIFIEKNTPKIIALTKVL